MFSFSSVFKFELLSKTNSLVFEKGLLILLKLVNKEFLTS